jgi:hypothetical protein
VEDIVVAEPAVYFLVVGRGGECRAKSGACKERETGSDVDFSTKIGNSNDEEYHTGKWGRFGISAAPTKQEIH